jgi:fluoride exporter
MRWVLVAVAGALGALTRYGLNQIVGPRPFPWTTLAINLTGSFALGLIVTAALQRHWSADETTAVTVGFLGAYTTFSTFAVEAVNLIRDDRIVAAATYVATSAGLGMLAAAAGIEVAQRYAR